MKNQLHKRMGWQTVWQVVGEFATHRMAATVACQWLNVSRARLYQLRRRWFEIHEKREDPNWLYRRRGNSVSQLDPDAQAFLREEAEYLKNQSQLFKGHFNFSFLAQRCHQKFGKRVSRFAVRRWMINQKLFDPQTDKTSKAFIRFETGGIGMLFQHDSSRHLWVPATGRQDILIGTIDDHSRKIVGARLVPTDSAWHNLCVVRETMERYGRPLGYYVDNGSAFGSDEDLVGHFGRALKSVEVDLKFTGVRQPQAKGKIEKRWDYLQRRLPYLCERYHITNLTQANKILQKEVIAYFNECHIHAETGEIPDKRWQKALEEGRSYLRPLEPKTPLDQIFALHYKRDLKKDGSIRFAAQRFEIPNAPRHGEVTLILRPPTGAKRPHTELTVLYQGSTLKQFILPQGFPKRIRQG